MNLSKKKTRNKYDDNLTFLKIVEVPKERKKKQSKNEIEKKIVDF